MSELSSDAPKKQTYTLARRITLSSRWAKTTVSEYTTLRRVLALHSEIVYRIGCTLPCTDPCIVSGPLSVRSSPRSRRPMCQGHPEQRTDVECGVWMTFKSTASRKDGEKEEEKEKEKKDKDSGPQP